jgi:hypothetical protein
VSHGMLLNGAIALLVPAVALARRARAESMPAAAVRPVGMSLRTRMAELGVGVSLPLAMQAIYIVCLPFAGREGTGATTSFGYAYLIGSAIVAVTASSLGLVTSVPLTRGGVDPAAAARHVVASSWIAVIAIGGAASVFGLAGETILHSVLGSSYGASVGTELGRLIVVLAPWALVSVGLSVAFPLIFVVDRGSLLPPIAVGAVLLHVPFALLGQTVAGLDGLAVALAATTLLMLVALLAVLRALRDVVRGLTIAAITVCVLAALAFVPPSLVLGRGGAAATGLAIYVALLVLTRPRGMRAAWRYLHQLS